jgi:hypothetical protein
MKDLAPLKKRTWKRKQLVMREKGISQIKCKLISPEKGQKRLVKVSLLLGLRTVGFRVLVHLRPMCRGTIQNLMCRGTLQSLMCRGIIQIHSFQKRNKKSAASVPSF